MIREYFIELGLNVAKNKILDIKNNTIFAIDWMPILIEN